MRIVHVLTVPMTLPLDAELPEADATAAEVLGRAKLVAASAGISARTATVRARSVAEGLAEDARRSSARAIVVRLHHRDCQTVGAHVILSRTVRTLLKAAPCPVYLLHLPHREHVVSDGDAQRWASPRKRDFRGWLSRLWERFVVGCMIVDTSGADSGGTCVPVHPYLNETLRIRELHRARSRVWN